MKIAIASLTVFCLGFFFGSLFTALSLNALRTIPADISAVNVLDTIPEPLLSRPGIFLTFLRQHANSIQNTKTINNTIWAAQDLLAQAKDALDLLFGSNKSDSGRLKERKRK